MVSLKPYFSFSVTQIVKYKIGNKVKFFCKYKNEEVIGEIINIRQAKYNWDYSIRYQVYIDFIYVQWVKEQDILEIIKK